MKLLWIEVGRVYDDKAIAFDLPSVVFVACKVLDLNSIFVEDVKALCLDAENAKQAIEHARIAEKTTSDAVIAQLRADKATAGAKITRWEIVLYASVGGVLFFLIACAIEFLIIRRSANASKKPIEKPARPSEATARSQNPRARLEPIALSEAAFERDLEEEVAAINVAQDEAARALMSGPIARQSPSMMFSMAHTAWLDGDADISEGYADNCQTVAVRSRCFEGL